jgi:hypothetical protein
MPKDQHKQRKWRLLAWAAAIALVASLPFGSEFGLVPSNCDHASPARHIFEGIVFGCNSIERSAEGGGALYWARVDLTAPGIELFVTPLDPIALAQNWQYRLRRLGTVVDEEHLAIAVNGSLFASTPHWRPRLPGDLARGVETTVANRIVSHAWEHTYLLWFDDQLTPTLRPSKPPAPGDLAKAKWGIGGQGVHLHEGRVWSGADRRPDSRTAVGIDEERKLLYLAVGEKISPRLILQKLADFGAREGMLLDGGRSSSMAIGNGARGVTAGTMYGGSRPVATHFGVRANLLQLSNNVPPTNN